MKNTNFQNLRNLLKDYAPETFGIVSKEECKQDSGTDRQKPVGTYDRKRIS